MLLSWIACTAKRGTIGRTEAFAGVQKLMSRRAQIPVPSIDRVGCSLSSKSSMIGQVDSHSSTFTLSGSVVSGRCLGCTPPGPNSLQPSILATIEVIFAMGVCMTVRSAVASATIAATASAAPALLQN